VVLAGVIGVSACQSGQDLSTSGNLNVKVTIKSRCLAIGDEEKVEIEAVPGTSVTYAVQYSDSALHGETPTGTIGDNRHFSATWRVPADAPTGKGTITVLAVAGKRTAKRPFSFTVVAEGASCP
jgi:hypothetical protein